MILSVPESTCLSAFFDLATAIDRASRVDEIYGAALDALASTLGICRSSVLLFDSDGVMRFKAWRGISAEYRKAVEGHTPWRQGETGAEPLLVADVASDSALADFMPAIRAEGLGAMAFIPLTRAGGVIGKFMLYFDEPRSLDGAELLMAKLIATQVSFAIEGFRAEREMADNHARLKFALDAANMGSWEWELATQKVHWSDNLERLHGLAPGSFDGSFGSYEKEIHPDDRARVFASLERAMATDALHDVEYRIVRPDGTIRWVEGKGHVERDDSGAPLRMTGLCMDVTPRKLAEKARLEAIEESSRVSHRLAAIVESSDDAIVGKDLNGIITSWNPAAERMFGYAAAEAIGRSITLVIPEDRLAEEVLVMESIRAGKALEMETIRVRKDGTRVEIEFTVSPVRDLDGTIVGASKIARDIGARKRSEAELAGLHRGLTTLVGASASLLQSPDTESVRTATIGIARQLLDADGYAVWRLDSDPPAWRVVKSDGMPEEFETRVIPQSAETAPAAATFLAEPMVVEDVEGLPVQKTQHDYYRRDGIRSMLVCPMRFGAGGIGTLVFYYRQPHQFDRVEVQTAQALANLSAAALNTAELYDAQRKQREAAESAGRYSAFLANATAALSESLDYEETLRSVAKLAVPDIADWCSVDIVNEAGKLERLAIAHVDEAKLELVHTLERLYPPDPESQGGPYAVMRSGRPAMMEDIPLERLTAAAGDDGHRRLLEELAICSYISVPLSSPAGTFGVITFAYAQSNRHYAKADLHFAQDVAAHASLAIENARAYRQTREANRLKDEFLATLSHELRTPLNAILGYAQMLKMRMLSGRHASQAVNILTRNAEVLRQIIDDVLDVSRIVAGKLRLNMRPTDLSSVLKNAVATVRPGADAKGVAIELAIDRAARTVSGDPDRLQQIVWNLLSNAVKFTPGGGRVKVTLANVDSFTELEVTDTGQGIDADFLPHVFERFRQGDSRFARDYGGLGLGLSIVRELVQLHGGSVSAASEGPGKGSTFRVRLPMVVRRPEPREKRRPLPNERRTTRVGRGRRRLDGVRILAVDDELDALELLRTVLESAGAVVSTAASGAQALDSLRKQPQDLLIADVGMPKMDGVALVGTIRKTLPFPVNTIPAVAVTAYARSEDRATALASGFQKHIAKPLNPAELVSAVSALVGRSSRPRMTH